MPAADWRRLAAAAQDINASADLAVSCFEALYSVSGCDEFMKLYISDETRQGTKNFLQAAARHLPKLRSRIEALFNGKTDR